MVVIILSIAHTGGSGDMPPKVSCCFLTKSLKRKKSHTFPCPRYRIFQLAINKRDKVIFHWVSSLLWLTWSCRNFGTAWAKRYGCVTWEEQDSAAQWVQPLGISPDLDGQTQLQKLHSLQFTSGGVITVSLYIWGLSRGIEPCLSHRLHEVLSDHKTA